MKIKNLFIYPIKSLGGFEISSGQCLEQGMMYDRRMMLVDENGTFISQREYPRMALIGAEMNEDGFTFFKKNKKTDQIFIPHNVHFADSIAVSVWKHIFTAHTMSGIYSEWFKETLGIHANLVKIDKNCTRSKSLDNSPFKSALSLADGYPYLIISEASLADLNRRLIVPVHMDRFRPNFVLEDSIAYGEEEIGQFKVADAKFRMIKPCARCVMTTIDQKTGNKLVEPLKTLSTYKKQGNKIYFGMNAVVIDEGMVSKGDEIIL